MGEPMNVGRKLNSRTKQTREDKIRLAKIGIENGFDAETIRKLYGLTMEEVAEEAGG